MAHPGPTTPHATDATPQPTPTGVVPVRTRAAGVALVTGAAALAVAEIVHPQDDTDGDGGMLAAFAAQSGRWTAWALLIMATAMLCLPGVIAWHARVRGRGSRLTTAGAIIFGGALIALFSFGESNGEGVALAGTTLPVPETLVEAYQRVDSTSVPLFVMFLIAIPGFHLGLPVFLAGLARARLISPWLAAAGGTAAVLSIGIGSVHPVLGMVAFAAVAGVLAVLGVRLITGSGTGSRQPVLVGHAAESHPEPR